MFVITQSNVYTDTLHERSKRLSGQSKSYLYFTMLFLPLKFVHLDTKAISWP